MARKRIRSAAPSPRGVVKDLFPTGTVPVGSQVAQQGFASHATSPNADASTWGRLRWNWIYQSAHRVHRGRLSMLEPWEGLEDSAHEIALHVVELLERGESEQTAYRRAESLASSIALDDRTCGLTGDLHELRHVRTDRGDYPLLVDPWEVERHGRRLTPGDWRALRTFIARQNPDPKSGKQASARRLLTGLLCERRSFYDLCEELGLTEAAAMSARSRAIAACQFALGMRATRTYDKRRNT